MKERDFEAWLTQHAPSVFAGEEAGDHVPDERLARLAEQRRPLSRSDLRHLAGCAECREVAADLWAELPERVPLLERLRAWLRPAPLAAAFAALLIAFLVFPRDALRPKGTDPTLTAAVTLVATSSDGTQRDVRDGGRLAPGDRLGFRYGNPKRRHQTLAIIGWDGSQLHWYYPEEPNGPPAKLSGELSVRLPFDVRIGSDHRAGPLTIAAAFDVEPSVLAEHLEKGTTADLHDCTLIRLEVIR